MKVWKAVVISIVVVVFTAYLIGSIFFFNNRSDERVCNNLNITFQNAENGQCVTENEIIYMLNARNLNPKGKSKDAIKLSKIEKSIAEMPAVRKVSCFRTSNGDVTINVIQRLPYYKVMTASGNYYVDTERATMPVSSSYTAYVPIVSGAVTKELATHELYDFVVFLQKDNFLSSQIEQIHLLSNGHAQLVPRVGNHTIYLGPLTDYQAKLEKLKLFYTKALNEVGWNRYSAVDLRYKDQVVCTKRY